MTQPLPPAECETMREVRIGVDATDRALVALLATRFGYMNAAARIKNDRNVVRDEVRKAQVLDNVARDGAALGIDPERLRAVWDALIEQSIAHELVEWDRIKG